VPVGVGNELVKLVGPELVEEPAEFVHAPGVRTVEPVPAFFAGHDKSGLFQQQQVL
jgi:hypothetical protein